MFTLNPLLVLAGAGTGALIGLTGVGGGAVMTPILLLVFGFAPAAAIGTDLWFAAITKFLASHVHHRRGLIDWQIVRRLWLGSLPATLLAVMAMKIGLIGRETAGLLNLLIGLAVSLTAVAMFFQMRLRVDQPTTETRTVDSFQVPVTVVAGALLGALVTFTSVGAGVVCTVFLAYLYPRRLNASSLIATDIAHAVPLTLLAGAGHLLIGNIDFSLLGNLLIGSVPGVVAGALLSALLPQATLRKLLSVILLATGFKLLSATL